jgi:hypothetical protein
MLHSHFQALEEATRVRVGDGRELELDSVLADARGVRLLEEFFVQEDKDPAGRELLELWKQGEGGKWAQCRTICGLNLW